MAAATAKRRKVVSTAAPSVYAGFSSTDVSGTRQAPRATGEGGGVKGQGSKYGVGAGATAGTSRVRKVHRLASEKDTVTGGGGGDVITPSSWRVGKELAERILKAQQRAEQLLSSSSSSLSSSTAAAALDRSPPLPHPSSSSSSPSFASSLHDSLDPHTHSPSSASSTSTSTLLGHTPNTNLGLPDEPRPPATSTTTTTHPRLHSGSEAAKISHEGSENEAPKLSAATKQLLEELRSPVGERGEELGLGGGGGGGGGLEGISSFGGRREGVAGARAAASKSKYSYGKP